MIKYFYIVFNAFGKVIKIIPDNQYLTVAELFGIHSFAVQRLNLLMERFLSNEDMKDAHKIKLLCWGSMKDSEISRINRNLIFKKRK